MDTMPDLNPTKRPRLELLDATEHPEGAAGAVEGGGEREAHSPLVNGGAAGAVEGGGERGAHSPLPGPSAEEKGKSWVEFIKFNFFQNLRMIFFLDFFK